MNVLIEREKFGGRLKTMFKSEEKQGSTHIHTHTHRKDTREIFPCHPESPEVSPLSKKTSGRSDV